MPDASQSDLDKLAAHVQQLDAAAEDDRRQRQQEMVDERARLEERAARHRSSPTPFDPPADGYATRTAVEITDGDEIVIGDLTKRGAMGLVTERSTDADGTVFVLMAIDPHAVLTTRPRVREVEQPFDRGGTLPPGMTLSDEEAEALMQGKASPLPRPGAQLLGEINAGLMQSMGKPSGGKLLSEREMAAASLSVPRPIFTPEPGITRLRELNDELARARMDAGDDALTAAGAWCRPKPAEVPDPEPEQITADLRAVTNVMTNLADASTKAATLRCDRCQAQWSLVWMAGPDRTPPGRMPEQGWRCPWCAADTELKVVSEPVTVSGDLAIDGDERAALEALLAASMSLSKTVIEVTQDMITRRRMS